MGSFFPGVTYLTLAMALSAIVVWGGAGIVEVFNRFGYSLF